MMYLLFLHRYDAKQFDVFSNFYWIIIGNISTLERPSIKIIFFLSYPLARRILASEPFVVYRPLYHNHQCKQCNFDNMTKVRVDQNYYVLLNRNGHIGTDPQLCHLWDSNPHKGVSL